MHTFFLFLVAFLPFLAFCNEDSFTISPAEIEKQLQDANEEFARAKSNFAPWYSGPLLTGSAHTIPVGKVNTQPYIFVIDNHSRYSNNRKSRSIDNLVVINPLNILQFGLWPNADFVITLGGVYQIQNQVSGGGFSDVEVELGLQLAEEGLYTPAAKMYAVQSFPTGKFQKSSPRKQGLDLSGNGSFVTSLSFNTSKVVWWIFNRPMNLRLTLLFDVYTSPIKVKGINAYGGAENTKGTITKGHEYKLNFGFEGSLSKKLSTVCDVVYTYSDASFFQGSSGTNQDGSIPINGSSSSDILSIAPGLEYNFDANSGLVAGMWFSVYGRNENDFIGGILTYQVTF